MNIDKNNNCPVCQADADFKFLRSHFDSAANQEYKLYACGECGVWFWQPLKNPGAEWYEQDKRYASRNVDPDFKPNWNYKKVISFLKPFTGRVLDIGCGTGNFLAYAERNGWEANGIDFDSAAIKTATEIFKLDKVEVAEISDYYKSNNTKQFDLITFFDVFEHLDNHVEFIGLVKKLLKSGGYVAMSMPYRRHADWLMTADLPPRHLTKWDRTAIKNFLSQNGFQISYIARRSEGLSPILMKLRFRYGRFFSFNLVGKYKDRQRAAEKKILPAGQAHQTVKKLQLLARIKDWLIFGLPALIIWLVMLPGAKRYLNLYVIAQKKE